MLQRSLIPLFALTFLLLAACAPAAGRASVQYEAPSADIISAVAEIGITMQPSSSYNFFSINSINDRFVTLQADTTGGVSFFFGGSNITLNFTALANGGVTTLAASGDGNAGLVNDSIAKIITQLDARFTRLK